MVRHPRVVETVAVAVGPVDVLDGLGAGLIGRLVVVELPTEPDDVHARRRHDVDGHHIRAGLYSGPRCVAVRAVVLGWASGQVGLVPDTAPRPRVAVST